MKKIAAHIGIIATGLFAIFGIPLIHYSDRLEAFLKSEPDAVSSASLVLPKQPSGEFLVLVNKSLHTDTLEDWTDFFLEEPVGVIFEDLHCIVIDTDVSGGQLAERYQARLAENQMQIRRQNGLLAISRAQWGKYDVMILSKELADAYALSTVCEDEGNLAITVKGDGL